MRGFLRNPSWGGKYKAPLACMNIERYPGFQNSRYYGFPSCFLPENFKDCVS